MFADKYPIGNAHGVRTMDDESRRASMPFHQEVLDFNDRKALKPTLKIHKAGDLATTS